MMRWNSTKTYTEDDILRMQQEAVMRVHEFQSRAKTLPFYDVPENAITPYEEPPQEIAYPEAPYEAPQDQAAEPEPLQQVHQSPPQEEPARPQPEPQYAPPAPMNFSPNQTPPPPADPITGILSKLNLDGETLLILGLMFLLYNEKADNVLLIALAYLLL